MVVSLWLVNGSVFLIGKGVHLAISNLWCLSFSVWSRRDFVTWYVFDTYFISWIPIGQPWTDTCSHSLDYELTSIFLDWILICQLYYKSLRLILSLYLYTCRYQSLRGIQITSSKVNVSRICTMTIYRDYFNNLLNMKLINSSCTEVAQTLL